MFTGIVERIGVVRSATDLQSTRRFVIECGALAGALAPGDSVAVDGACFTATELEPDAFAVDVIGTSLERTVAAGYVAGTGVNLERALEMGGRLDGHLVQGHVDGLGHMIQSVKQGEFWMMDFDLPADVARLTVERGSVAINGVSLTVAAIPADRICRVGLIPYTHDHTNLGRLRAGDPVNVEGDLIGKYVGRILAAREREDTRT